MRTRRRPGPLRCGGVSAEESTLIPSGRLASKGATDGLTPARRYSTRVWHGRKQNSRLLTSVRPTLQRCLVGDGAGRLRRVNLGRRLAHLLLDALAGGKPA